MGKIKRLISNTAILGAGTFISKVLVFLLMPLYTACLSSAEFGVADILMQTANLIIPIAVIGVSKDSIASHVKFAEKYSLPFILLSDPEKLAIEAYGVWQEKKMCGKLSMGVVRTTFIIEENGVVEKVMDQQHFGRLYVLGLYILV